MINNQIYSELGDRWISAQDDPVALLRAENRFRNPWLIERLQAMNVNPGDRVLDIGCGAGFLCRDLARAGFQVTGVDQSEGAIATARKYCSHSGVDFHVGEVAQLGKFAKFKAVFVMDVLEHVENPRQTIETASQLLAPDGVLFFYTFNRTWLSYLLVIRAVELFVKNTPKNLHLYRMFIKPSELRAYAHSAGFRDVHFMGVAPKILQPAMLQLVLKGQVSDDFEFQFVNILTVGYLGYCRK